MDKRIPNERSASDAVLLLGYAVTAPFAVAVLPKIEGYGREALVYGIVLGQFGMLAIWAALGPQHFAVRLPATLAAAVGLHGCIRIGLGETYLTFIYLEALLLPIVFLVFQSPFWIARGVFNWRLIAPAPASCSSPPVAGQFGVRHLMGATGVAGAGLAVGLFAFRTLGRGELPERLLLQFLVITFVAALGTLPCLCAGLAVARTATGSTLMTVYAVVMLLAITATEFLSRGVIAFNHTQAISLITALTVVFTSLRMLHSRGYRLATRRGIVPIAPAVGATADAERERLEA